MNILEIILYYVLVPLFVLGVAVNIHEFGHFIVAKLFGMRVEAYSFFGLGPRLFGFRWGNTDYRISAIPLGAYVKLYGDESNSGLEGKDDTSESIPASELYELRPRWQKFLVMIGGPFMNIVLSLGIPFVGGLIYGVPAMPKPIIAVVEPGSAGQQAGVQVGDRIVAFNSADNPTWNRITNDAALHPEQDVPIVVERNGQRVSLNIKPLKKTIGGQDFGVLGIEPDSGARPVIVANVEPETPASEAGLQAGDHIVSINGNNIRNWQQLLMFVDENKGKPLQVTIDRNGQIVNLNTQTRKLSDGRERLGFAPSRASLPLEPAGVSAAFTHAVNTNIEVLQMTGTALGQVFSGNRSARDTVSGPIGIFQQSALAAQIGGWEGIFQILMLISLSLGVFNLLPIPMLDGGQIFVLAIEGVFALFGLQLSMVVRERIQFTGLAIILLLMVTVIVLDISKIVGR